jgi:hypothetical protein
LALSKDNSFQELESRLSADYTDYAERDLCRKSLKIHPLKTMNRKAEGRREG